MKNTYMYIAAFAAMLLGIVTIFIGGCASTPPTAVEQKFFDIKTNVLYVNKIETNVVPITVVHTNIVIDNVGVTVTNYTPVLSYITNTVFVTKTNESYVFTPGQGAADVRTVGTEVGNIFGVGGMVGTALGALFSLWRYIRSKKNYVTAANIAQTVETMREFIKSLPDGARYDNELVNWMQKNQANAGVLQSVIALVAREVSNPDAKDAAQNIQTLIEGLKLGTTPPVPPANV
jgi:hypothetical protein